MASSSSASSAAASGGSSSGPSIGEPALGIIEFGRWYTAGHVTKEFAYVIMVAILAYIVNVVLVAGVVKARKKFGIKAPRMTETTSASAVTPEEERHLMEGAAGELKPVPFEYMCAHRAHLNNLENLPFFYAALVIGGIGFPIPTAFLGLLSQCARLFSGIGYWSGPSSKMHRMGFAVAFSMDVALVGILIAFAYNLLIDRPRY
mmetsp:Transcript_48490/g.113871  ORF Transcript_48490/g.113871 Transcript_48490/m.113871 type:complete len:204 (+) Transcript_48490:27-638(+)|eukprot:CAMPEP_0175848368 /NCGR_PEP_ID=MMETSP0107_2-20121207/23887_1 /TAXON_ID=195067 ORGANISM="Goniomonas pacifica, Strain CCMP1869" /NCGR_SAMPLE_ID=MMETSP0107_2 /ASSEMBLY_ACC=CAM_ASM_000203 /LENGTH=203 /DNA_ID=CAMNT_0017163321 /DNA_START=38 /DNA_END=649 /DNA_ORIENTATION=-